MRIVALSMALVVLMGGCSGTLGRGVPTHPDQLKSLRIEGKGQRGITVRPDGGGSLFWEVHGRASDTQRFPAGTLNAWALWNELRSIAGRPRAIDGRVNPGAYHFIAVIDPDLDGIEVNRHTFFPIPYRHGPRIEALIEQAVAAPEAAP